jgi:RNA polymerase sigma-70 factor (ECF subfamily)
VTHDDSAHDLVGEPVRASPDHAPGLPAMSPADPLVDDLFRREAGNISAWLARLLGPSRLDLIEDAVQDAFGAALARWPLDGAPERPAAWLAVAARNKAFDRLRRDARLDPLDESAAWRLGISDPESTGRIDDTLALMFVACHPVLEPDEQTMLTLKTVCGFGVKEIARLSVDPGGGDAAAGAGQAQDQGAGADVRDSGWP